MPWWTLLVIIAVALGRQAGHTPRVQEAAYVANGTWEMFDAWAASIRNLESRIAAANAALYAIVGASIAAFGFLFSQHAAAWTLLVSLFLALMGAIYRVPSTKQIEPASLLIEGRQDIILPSAIENLQRAHFYYETTLRKKEFAEIIAVIAFAIIFTLLTIFPSQRPAPTYTCPIVSLPGQTQTAVVKLEDENDF